ncbi:MAG: 23S rRNA (adenine(2503)-C(2))-methyltransferase RlmN [Gammaproteobacteria bacterium]|nr:23S rRNA (adenine(2503)-C(2))-methyltransferase RlmN [Gammaproteobacteria bacterium]
MNLVGLDRSELEQFFVERDEKKFRAQQVLQWMYQRGVTNINEMTDLSKSLRELLQKSTEIAFPNIESEHFSEDGTIKWLLSVGEDSDGKTNAIEAVYIPESTRGTLCISSQVGCALDCTFCATARQGFNRNLTAAEIIGQVWVADQRLRALYNGKQLLTNVVFMGMGEPLLNFKNVLPVINLLLDDHAYGMGKRKVTVSTSGVVPNIDELSQAVDVSLAISLHAPTNEVRNELVPINRKYPIEELLAACKRYLDNKNRRESVTFEYVMLDGVNDSQQQARQLVKLLKGIRAKINLIPFNSFEQSGYQRSSQQAIDQFSQVLMQNDIVVITRRPRGEDIAAACGQLAGQVADRAHRGNHYVRMFERSLISRRIETECV